MKDEIISILHEPGLQELMPEDVRGVMGAELHWAVCYMKKLHDRGRLDTPLPMFETVRSAEVIGLEEEVNRLKERCSMYHSAINQALIPLQMGRKIPSGEIVRLLKLAQKVPLKAKTWDEFKQAFEDDNNKRNE